MVCDVSYSLPQGGTIKKYMGKTCPLDNFELVLFSTGGANGIGYPLCPYCYSNPPFQPRKDVVSIEVSPTPNTDPAGDKPANSSGENVHAMGCHQCSHPTCEHALPARALRDCPETKSCGGTLCFDPTSGPLWKAICNSCNFILHFTERAHKVTLQREQRCDTCTARLVKVDFHRDYNPLSSGTELTACLWCDPILAKTCESSYGHLRKQRARRGGRGRGRGRGKSRYKGISFDPIDM